MTSATEHACGPSHSMRPRLGHPMFMVGRALMRELLRLRQQLIILQLLQLIAIALLVAVLALR